MLVVGTRRIAGRSAEEPNSVESLVSLNDDGTLNLSFVPGYGRFLGGVGNGMPRSASLLSDGSVLISGSDYLSSPVHDGHDRTGYIERRRPDGTFDESFGGLASGGHAGRKGVARFTTRKPPYFSAITKVVVLPSGKILAGGYVGFQLYVARLTARGRLDRKFGPKLSPGSVTSSFGKPACRCAAGGDIAVDGKGRIVQVGHTTYPGQEEQETIALVRYKRSGEIDRTFGRRGRRFLAEKPFVMNPAVAIQPNGRILVTSSQGFMNRSRMVLQRFMPNGRRDRTFFRDGRYTAKFGSVTTADEIAIDSRGRAVVAGGAAIGATGHFFVSRFILK